MIDDIQRQMKSL